MNNGITAKTAENPVGIQGSLDQVYSDIIFKTLNSVANTPIDYETISQNQLDLIGRSRVNLFPWRGQFSPELIESLLKRYAKTESVILDPFCGSGTTLFESSRRSLNCFGTEVNPAAIEMANTVKFANLSKDERESYIKEAKSILDECYPLLGNGLSRYCLDSECSISEETLFKRLLKESSSNFYIYNIAINTLMRYHSTKNKKSNPIFDAFRKHTDIIRLLPFRKNNCEVYHCDARKTPLSAESVDLIVTSPPYINVFNYHQQYREIMELAGWNLLKIAKLEIGSNRKNRSNRFLTSIQYSIDMLLALSEMRRVLRPDGKIIIVIGRESNIRKISLENYKILSALAINGVGLNLDGRHERKFVNRFGKKIYEDILVFSLGSESEYYNSDFARAVALYLLKESVNRADGPIKENIELAIISASSVIPSPTYDYRTMRSSTYEFNTP